MDYLVEMIPQINTQDIPMIKEIPTYKQDMNGGFDFLIFYATDANSYYYDFSQESFVVSMNKYSESNYYFLKVGGTSLNSVIESKDINEIHLNTYNSYYDFIHQEENLQSILKSGREWLGKKYISSTTDNIIFEIGELYDGSDINVSTSLTSDAEYGSMFTISYRGRNVADISIKEVPNTKANTYSIKAINEKNYFSIDSDLVDDYLDLSIRYDKLNNSYGGGYIDYFTLTFKKKDGFFRGFLCNYASS